MELFELAVVEVEATKGASNLCLTTGLVEPLSTLVGVAPTPIPNNEVNDLMPPDKASRP